MTEKLKKSDYIGNSTTKDEDILLKYLSKEETQRLSEKIRERTMLKWPESRNRISSTIDDFIQAVENTNHSETILNFPIDKNIEQELLKAFEIAEKETLNKCSDDKENIPTHEELLELLEHTLTKIDKEIADLKNR